MCFRGFARRRMTRLNVILFHKIAPAEDAHSVVHPRVFTACLDLLDRLGAEVRTLAGYDEPASEPAIATPVCVTFDDGWSSDAEVALPELARRGLSATFFVVTGRIGHPGFLSWLQVRMLAAQGMEIGSHTVSHPNLTRLGPGPLRDELRRSRQDLQDCLGRDVVSLSVPHGFYSRAVLTAAWEAGYRRVCTSRPGLNHLPLRPGVPIRRNALHREVRASDLLRFARPQPPALIRAEASYYARALLKQIVGEGGYRAVRSWVFRRAAR